MGFIAAVRRDGNVDHAKVQHRSCSEYNERKKIEVQMVSTLESEKQEYQSSEGLVYRHKTETKTRIRLKD